MSGKTGLKIIDKETLIYARPDGSHFHLDRQCNMLQNGDYERLEYTIIDESQIKERKLYPCACAYQPRNKETG